MGAWDMVNPFVIPDLIGPYAHSVKDHWCNMKLTGVNLLKNWGMLILSQFQNWQHESFDYACTDNLTSMGWAKTLMMNSCDIFLMFSLWGKRREELCFAVSMALSLTMGVKEIIGFPMTHTKWCKQQCHVANCARTSSSAWHDVSRNIQLKSTENNLLFKIRWQRYEFR